MELGDRVKILVFLNLLYYILNFQGITVISLLSYFLFVALVLLTASNTFRKRRVSATPSEYVSRETVEKLFKATYGTVNYLHSRIASVADLKQLEKLLFVAGCLVGLIFLSSIFSDLSVMWLVGNAALIWPEVQQRFGEPLGALLETGLALAEDKKRMVIALIPKYSDLTKED